MANFYDPGEAAQYSMQLLRGQMLGQLLLGQISGISLNEFILGKPAPARSGRAMMNDALTGLMRSDAAMLHQASKNMGEGEVVSRLAGEGVQSVHEKISRMRDIAVQVQTSGAATLEQEDEFEALAAQVTATVENTDYNGIKLLDGGAWKGDSDNGGVFNNGNTGTLYLQAGRSPVELTLYNLDYLKGFSDSDLGTSALNATVATLDAARQSLAGMRESYAARAGLYASEAASYERQAGILDEATGKAVPGDEQSLKDALLNILLREQGMLINYSS
jgi:flagellin-like hook-associated protein FlgL